MDVAALATVRSFNRSVTQRIGVLEEEYLGRGRPLGASRVLWEIGREGTALRARRARLDLAPGYLSRLTRSRGADGLVAVEPARAARRGRGARLTRCGRRERE